MAIDKLPMHYHLVELFEKTLMNLSDGNEREENNDTLELKNLLFEKASKTGKNSGAKHSCAKVSIKDYSIDDSFVEILQEKAEQYKEHIHLSNENITEVFDKLRCSRRDELLFDKLKKAICGINEKDSSKKIRTDETAFRFFILIIIAHYQYQKSNNTSELESIIETTISFFGKKESEVEAGKKSKHISEEYIDSMFTDNKSNKYRQWISKLKKPDRIELCLLAILLGWDEQQLNHLLNTYGYKTLVLRDPHSAIIQWALVNNKESTKRFQSYLSARLMYEICLIKSVYRKINSGIDDPLNDPFIYLWNDPFVAFPCQYRVTKEEFEEKRNSFLCKINIGENPEKFAFREKLNIREYIIVRRLFKPDIRLYLSFDDLFFLICYIAFKEKGENGYNYYRKIKENFVIESKDSESITYSLCDITYEDFHTYYGRDYNRLIDDLLVDKAGKDNVNDYLTEFYRRCFESITDADKSSKFPISSANGSISLHQLESEFKVDLDPEVIRNDDSYRQEFLDIIQNTKTRNQLIPVHDICDERLEEKLFEEFISRLPDYVKSFPINIFFKKLSTRKSIYSDESKIPSILHDVNSSAAFTTVCTSMINNIKKPDVFAECILTFKDEFDVNRRSAQRVVAELLGEIMRLSVAGKYTHIQRSYPSIFPILSFSDIASLVLNSESFYNEYIIKKNVWKEGMLSYDDMLEIEHNKKDCLGILKDDNRQLVDMQIEKADLLFRQIEIITHKITCVDIEQLKNRIQCRKECLDQLEGTGRIEQNISRRRTMEKRVSRLDREIISDIEKIQVELKEKKDEVVSRDLRILDDQILKKEKQISEKEKQISENEIECISLGEKIRTLNGIQKQLKDAFVKIFSGNAEPSLLLLRILADLTDADFDYVRDKGKFSKARLAYEELEDVFFYKN